MPGLPKKLRAIAPVLALVFLSALPVQADPAELLHRQAPRFVRRGIDGRRISLRSFRDKVVLLTYWATWCEPCQVEMPRFIDWQSRLTADGLQIVAISLDDEAKPVRAFTAERRVNYPVLMGDARLARAYGGILGLPVNFLIDRQGRIAAVFKGETDLDEMESALRAVLGSK